MGEGEDGGEGTSPWRGVNDTDTSPSDARGGRFVDGTLRPTTSAPPATPSRAGFNDAADEENTADTKAREDREDREDREAAAAAGLAWIADQRERETAMLGEVLQVDAKVARLREELAAGVRNVPNPNLNPNPNPNPSGGGT